MTPEPVLDSARERTLIRIQAASGALFALFLCVHLLNQMFAAAGPEVYDALQGELRAVYQAPVLELVLVGLPLVVHIVVSVWRMVRRRRSGRARTVAPHLRWQRRTAVVLLVFTFGHILATRGSSLLYDIVPGFDAIAYTMVWNFGYFFPYYLVFSIAALYHLLAGLALGLPRIGLTRAAGARSRRAVVLAWAAGAVALTLGLAGFAGAWHDVRERAIASPYARLLADLGVADPPAR